MLGAILGDIVGSPYEFDHNNYKHKDFPLLSEKSHFTDDTVMTVAVARGLIAGKGIPERTCTSQCSFSGRRQRHPCLHHRRHCRSFLRDAAGTAGRDFETSAGGYPGSI